VSAIAGMPVRDGLPLPTRAYAIVTIALSITMSALDGTIVNLALPGMARQMGATPADAIWIVSAYQLAALTLLLPFAAMGDRIGYRKVYLTGIAVFTLASVGCFLSTSLLTLAISRGVQGAGAAGLMAINGAMLRLVYPKRLFGRGVAVNSAVIAAASAAGPSIAAAILSVSSWPWLFAVNVPLGCVIFTLGWRVLPGNVTRAPGGEPFSVRDVVLNAVMFGAVMLGTQSLGNSAGSTGLGGSVLGSLLLIGIGIAVGFVYLTGQLKLVLPLFPVDLLRIPIFRLSMCTSIASFASQTIAYVSLPFLLLEAWGRSAGEAGLLMSAWPLAVIGGAGTVGRLIGRYPGGLLGGIGMAALASGMVLLATAPAIPSNAEIALRMVLCGAGFGLFQSPNNHTILTSAPSHRSGAAGGMLGTARLTGQTLGGAVLMLVFTVAPPHSGHGPLLGLWVSAVFAATASVFSFLRVRHHVVS
jgi:MFS transporter, DHA2 family, multidrug resistance protein